MYRKKQFAFIILLLTIVTNNYAQNATGQFMLNGKISGESAGYIKLYYANKDGKQVKDSAKIVDGKFTLKGDISEPTMAWMEGNIKSRSMDDANATSLFLEPSVMTISLKANDFKHAIITGSKTQDEQAELNKTIAPIMEQMKPLDEAYEKASEAYRKAIESKEDEKVLDSMKYHLADMHDAFTPYQDKIKNKQIEYFVSHPNSYVTAYNLRYYTSDLPLDSLKMFYNAMNTQLQQSSYGKELNKEIEKLAAGSPGAVAKNFTATDINGNNLSFSDFKGKLVLIDFWASWCVPCRKSMPHVKALYEQYKNKGFDVIGVSDDDQDTTAWKKAVAKDGTGIWHNVLRGLDMQKIMNNEDNPNDISEKFGISSLPTKILIDKNGVIIGRYDKGTDEEEAAMDKKIEETLKG